LQDSNETLFYSLIFQYISEMMPIVYTPTVGLGCQRYSHIYRRPRGIFIAYPERHRIEKILENNYFNQVKVIVVSDGERILGLGDQGAGGMGISIGKLALYTMCAGIYPGFTLPVLLDSGTNNPALLNDPLYIGWHHERIRGEEYDEFIQLFIIAIKKRFPHVLLHWEDFAQQNANRLLERYQQELCSFNDDIQGTAATTVGTLLAAIAVTHTTLSHQSIVILGAGSAGCGISKLIMQAMIKEGLSENVAKKHFFLIDRDGLLTEDTKNLLSFQKMFAQNKKNLKNWQLKSTDKITLLDVIQNAKPTVLIGTSSQTGAFTEEIIRAMYKHTSRPIIFPLSNPTELSEATPADLLKWTNDNAIIGTGSPFPAISKNGQSFRVDQTNNCYIFPGLGLGLIAVKAKYVTDSMLMAAALALANASPAKKNPQDNLLPPLTDIREVSFKIAMAVATEAIHLGVAEDIHFNDLEKTIRQLMWIPEYVGYQPF